MSNQHEALVLSIFAPLAAHCSIRSTGVPRVLPDTLVLRCTLFIFCAKAALLAKRAATCDKVEISDNFDRWMSQQCCEWIGDKVDERKLSDKSPIPCPDHQEFANMVAAVYAQISSQNQPHNLHPHLQQRVMHKARRRSTSNSSRSVIA